MIKIKPDELDVLSKYIHAVSGIYLDKTKAYLVENRFSGLLQELGCGSFSELYYKAKADASKSIEKKIVEQIATHETLFFRDTAPFEMLKHKILPELIDNRNASGRFKLSMPIRIWSAACSTGQEVYSIAIVLKELLPDLRKYNIKLLGTDISSAAVAKASYGAYNKFEIERGLPPDKLKRYFTPGDNSWRVKDEIRAMAMFRKINLMDNFSSLGKFDIVMCRNVAIYFTEADRIRLFDKIAGVMEPDGYLVIGSTESLLGICPQFESKRHLRSVFYQLKQ